LEELVEFLPSRSSKSAIRCSRQAIAAETAACASGERVDQMCGGSGDRSVMPPFYRVQAAEATLGLERLLIRQWSDDTEHISSTTRIADHPACREIIAMGDVAVPLLLRELDNHPSILGLVSLKAITGINPFPPDARGNIARMAEA
jgi:hypothetical protein